jgi:hypothetical protein
MSIPRFSGRLDGREVVAVLALDYDEVIRQFDRLTDMYLEMCEEFYVFKESVRSLCDIAGGHIAHTETDDALERAIAEVKKLMEGGE